MQLRLNLDLPCTAGSVGAARRVLRGTLGGAGVDPTVTADLELAVGEACANAVAHAARPGGYAVRIRLDQQQCTIEVSDRGDGLRRVPGVLPAADCEHGRGLYLMALLTDDLRIHVTPGNGTTIALIKYRPLARIMPPVGRAG